MIHKTSMIRKIQTNNNNNKIYVHDLYLLSNFIFYSFQTL